MTQSSKHSVQESLSALVDGEISEFELRRLLNELDGDDADSLKGSWRTHHLGASAVRGEDMGFASVDLSASISAAIDQESEHSAVPLSVVKPVARAWNYLAKSAVAASVAAAVIFSAGQYGSGVAGLDAGNSVQTASSTAGPSGLPVGFGASAIEAQTVGTQTRGHLLEHSPVLALPESAMGSTPVSEVQVREFLQRVMTQHADQASLNSNRGLLPYARVAPSDAE